MEDDLKIDLGEYIVYVCGEISMPMAAGITQQMLALDLQNKIYGLDIPISMIINSPGGDLNAGWQIIEVMDYVSTPVHTTALGQIASCGLLVFMNGEPGERLATDRTSIMSHRYSWGTSDSHQNLISIGQEFSNIHDRMIKHYEECTGMSKSVIEQKLLCEHDVWLTAAQAKKFGIVDKVKESKKSKILKNKKKNASGAGGLKKIVKPRKTPIKKG